MQMHDGLGVDGDARRAGLDERLDVAVRSSIIRCTSSGMRATRASDFTTGGPIVMFGTKWPSITSTWIRSAPPRSAAATASPSAAKSAESSDGAIWSGRPLHQRLTSSEIGSPGAIWNPPCGLWRSTMPAGTPG